MTSLPRSVIAALLVTAFLLRPVRAAGTRDLVAAFPLASVGIETGLIDLGSPAARPHLVAGWGDDAFGFTWAIGTESIVEFHLAAPRDLALTIRCGPLEFPDAPPQFVTFELNGHAGPRVSLGTAVADHAVALSRGTTRSGLNRLRLHYAWARMPWEVSANPDRRRLSVVWDFIRFERGPEAPRIAPSADGASGVLTIPPGTSVGYQLVAEPGTRLSFDAVELDAGATLTVSLRDDRGREAVVGRASVPMSHRWEMALPPSSDGPVRLTLDANGGSARLHRPAVIPVSATTGRQPARAARPERRPNILVYLVDTLRADHLGCYGYDRPTSPHLDAFARDAILFTNARAESSWTRPTVASLFTGLAPPRHGVHGRPDALPGGTATMSRILRGVGYETAGFVTNGNVAPLFGFGQGFEQYDLLTGALIPDANGLVAEPLPGSGRLTARARQWLGARAGGRPFFLYLHAADPHGPYLPPDDVRRRFGVRDEAAALGSLDGLRRIQSDPRPNDETRATLVALYDAEIAHNDRQFGRLLAHLKRRALYDDTIIVFLADHGEEFHEHGAWEHGKSLYHEVLHVPLLIKLPGREHAGRRVDAPVQLADVLPSLLAQLGLPVPEGLDGRDALAALDDGAAGAARPTFSHLAMDGYVVDAVEDRGWKLITGWGGGELFDRRRDPDERANLVGEHLETAGELLTRLRRRLAVPRLAAALAETPSADVLRNLRALGYVD